MYDPTPDPSGELFALADGGGYLLRSRAETEAADDVRGHRFWMLDPSGVVSRAFEPSFDCDCEYSFHFIYALQGDRFIERMGKQNDMLTDSERRWSEREVARVARRLDPSDPDAVAILDRLALGRGAA